MYWKKLLISIFFLICLIILVYIIYIKTDQPNFNFDISNFNLFYLFLFILLIFLSVLFRTLRISYLFPPHKFWIKQKKFWIIFTSLPLSILIGGGGVFFRMFFLKKKEKISYLTSANNVFMEKILDIIIIFIILFLITIYLPQFDLYLNQRNILPLLSLVIVIFFGGIFYKKKLNKILFFFFNKFTHKFRWKLKKQLVYIDRGLNFFHQPKKILIFLSTTTLIWIIEIMMCYMVFASMNFKITLSESIFINTFNLLFLLLPLSPSGIGVIQASFLLSGKILNLPYNMLLVSIFFHIILLSSNAFLLLIGIHQLKISIKGLKKLKLIKRFIPTL